MQRNINTTITPNISLSCDTTDELILQQEFQRLDHTNISSEKSPTHSFGDDNMTVFEHRGNIYCERSKGRSR